MPESNNYPFDKSAKTILQLLKRRRSIGSSFYRRIKGYEPEMLQWLHLHPEASDEEIIKESYRLAGIEDLGNTLKGITRWIPDVERAFPPSNCKSSDKDDELLQQKIDFLIESFNQGQTHRTSEIESFSPTQYTITDTEKEKHMVSSHVLDSINEYVERVPKYQSLIFEFRFVEVLSQNGMSFNHLYPFDASTLDIPCIFSMFICSESNTRFDPYSAYNYFSGGYALKLLKRLAELDEESDENQ